MTEKAGLKQEKLQICYVHVCGAVKSPGVYELTSDSRLYEAIIASLKKNIGLLRGE